MKHRKVISLVPLLILVVWVYSAGAACAVRRNPNLTPATTWELNTAHQLQLLERDYRTFFIDVGDAHRQGILTDKNVTDLNTIGHQLKPAIERANQGFKLWQTVRDESTKQQVVILLLEAQRIWLELATRRATILNGEVHP